MKRLVLLVAVLGFICLFTGTAFGDIINVPTAEYPTIQAGIDAASSGDTVQVAPGTYYENITMKSGVVIQGAGAGDDPSIHSIIDGGGTDSVVTAIEVDSAAKLDGFKITNGSSSSGGGGMYNIYSSPTVTNCTFSGSSTTYDGGGMYNFYGSSPTVTNCTFSANSADRNGGGMGNFISSSPTVTNCTFSGNSATVHGGGIYNEEASPTVTNCTFSGNSTTYDGGGMYNLFGSSPTVTNCTFSANSADRNGGGMYNDSSSLTVTNCTFSENSADYGGGMYNDHSSPSVTSCTFSENSAVHDAGGMLNSWSSPTLSNCIFSGNSAAYNGGGVRNVSSPSTVTNCTFSANSADRNGGGMYNTGANSSVTATNNILWGDSPNEIFNLSATPSVTYSDIQGGYAGTGNINADPLFVDPDGPDNIPGNQDDDLHLRSGSPCIDSGTATGAPDTDIEGKPRPLGMGYDMGAYEFQGTTMPWILLLLLGD